MGNTCCAANHQSDKELISRPDSSQRDHQAKNPQDESENSEMMMSLSFVQYKPSRKRQLEASEMSGNSAAFASIQGSGFYYPQTPNTAHQNQGAYLGARSPSPNDNHHHQDHLRQHLQSFGRMLGSEMLGESQEINFTSDFMTLLGQKSELVDIAASKGSVIESPRATERNAIKMHGPPSDICEFLDSIPDYYLGILSKMTLTPFVFDQNVQQEADLPFLGPIRLLKQKVIYRGQWMHRKRQGKGEQFWEDRSYYVGYWKNNMMNGKGRMIHSDQSMYEGNWVNDQAEGKGVLTTADGGRYEGEFLTNKKHGKGSETWTDGTTYEGQYVLGKKHGIGKFKWRDGSIYQGNFSNDDMNGYGECIWSNGKKYKGTWKDSKMHGNGEYIWPDGKKYIGEYINDVKVGFGEFFWPDGRRFKGQWVNGKQHGKGVFRDTKGLEKKGEWSEGKHLRWL